MRRKVDSNQAAIVRALRDAGCTVAVTSGLGDGFPDIVVGIRCRNYLFEIKDGSLPPSRRKLTEAEAKFHGSWRGDVQVISSVEEAIRAVSRL